MVTCKYVLDYTQQLNKYKCLSKNQSKMIDGMKYFNNLMMTYYNQSSYSSLNYKFNFH